MKLVIKNMVCPRCITSVEQIFKGQRIVVNYVHLGEVETITKLNQKQLNLISTELQNVGFELLDDAKSQQIEKIKNLLIQKVQTLEIEEHFSIHKYLTAHIFKDYSSLSKLFSEVEGITMEQFFILQKIEKIKELLFYNEQSLGEIALSLGYSSSQHLSGQFKKLTGMTPTQFKALGANHRNPIDAVR